MVQFLRVLFPSWRFFDRLAPKVELDFRYSTDSGNLGAWCAWRSCRFPHRRGLFLNETGNLAHACQSLLENAAREVSDCKSAEVFAGSPTYRILGDLTRYFLPEEARFFQFKIKVGDDELLLSDQHEV